MGIRPGNWFQEHRHWMFYVCYSVGFSESRCHYTPPGNLSSIRFPSYVLGQPPYIQAGWNISPTLRFIFSGHFTISTAPKRGTTGRYLIKLAIVHALCPLLLWLLMRTLRARVFIVGLQDWWTGIITYFVSCAGSIWESRLILCPRGDPSSSRYGAKDPSRWVRWVFDIPFTSY